MHGYYQTHISDIIKEAQIARGTVYQYFNNKDDIFVTLVDTFYENWKQMYSFQLENTDFSAMSAKDYLRYRIRQTFIFLSKDPDLCHIALRVGIGLPDEVSQSINRFEERVMDIIAEDLHFGQKEGNVSKLLHVETTAAILTGALLRTAHHFFVNKKKKKGYSRKQIQEMTENFVSVFSNGIFMPKKRGD